MCQMGLRTPDVVMANHDNKPTRQAYRQNKDNDLYRLWKEANEWHLSANISILIDVPVHDMTFCFTAKLVWIFFLKNFAIVSVLELGQGLKVSSIIVVGYIK